jgi:hypothetical protein
MWTYDEVVRKNPAQRGQRASILTRLVDLRAATPQLLIECSNKLEDYGPPFMCCLAQLPFPLILEPGSYKVQGDTKGVHFIVDFHLFSVDVNRDCQTQLTYIKENAALGDATNAIGTQVIAFVELWGRRVDYYKNYLACLHADGLEEQIINPTLWDKARAPAAYAGNVITSHAFEAELASRVLSALRITLRRVLANYSLLALEELPWSPFLYGYFLMPAPGRVVYGNAPESVIRGMLPKSSVPKPVAKEHLEKAMQFQIREVDRYLHQLMAMKRLSTQGEPELAVVGAVTAIEWFMNSLIAREPAYSLSIPKCLKKPPFSALPVQMIQNLNTLAETRNLIVHGEPPERKRNRSGLHKGAIQPDEVVKLGLSLYREIHLRKLTLAE